LALRHAGFAALIRGYRSRWFLNYWPLHQRFACRFPRS
jgi:hypothetical protein